LTAAVAGIRAGDKRFRWIWAGRTGYAKRYGASYADLRYKHVYRQCRTAVAFEARRTIFFIRGTGSVRSRILYALAASVICKGDNGHWQANYSAIAGGLAAVGFSNLYYSGSGSATERH